MVFFATPAHVEVEADNGHGHTRIRARPDCNGHGLICKVINHNDRETTAMVTCPDCNGVGCAVRLKV